MVDERRERLRPRWGALLPVVIVGVGFVVWAVAWQGRDAWPGVFVNVGTGVLLAGVLVFLEPSFTRRITRAVTKDVAEQVTAQVTEATERRLAAHLDEMNTLVEEQLNHRRRTRAAEVDKLSEPTHDRVLDVFQRAAGMNALSGDSLIIPASDPPTPIRLHFRFLGGNFRLDGRADHKEVSILVLGAPRRASNVGLPWPPGTSAQHMGVALIESLQKDGAWRSGLIDWEVALRNLQHGLGIAIAHRDGTETDLWSTTQPVSEYLGEKWIITDAGIESSAFAAPYIFPFKSFPQLPDAQRPAPDRRPREALVPDGWPSQEWPPPAPPVLDSVTWQSYLYRALDLDNSLKGDRLRSRLSALQEADLGYELVNRRILPRAVF
ncbi:hypothetical protein AB0F52_46220 [Amycolatopsis sp. NPDC024027]|uniref:hypothetical protein n=1 Tax=Amycolatopsis sp. NPDC024027 TaxID=3154327 RepID=UPI0033EEA525